MAMDDEKERDPKDKMALVDTIFGVHLDVFG